MQCIALFCLSSCCYIHFAGLIFPHLCRRLCGMAVLAEFLFYLQGFAFMATHRDLCTLIVKLYAHTQLPLSRGFFIRVLISVASVHNSALLLFCRSIFFFFSLHITVLWHGTLGCFLLLFSWWFLCFLSFCWWGASSFFHPLLACFSRNFFIKTNFSLAMFSIVVACGLLRFSFCSHQHAGMLQGWLPRGRALRKTWFHLVWLKCSRPKWPLKLVYVC